MNDDINFVNNPIPKFSSNELIDVKKLASEVEKPWFNQTLCEVNDSVIRLGVAEGEFHWHKHDLEDEFFYVVDGLFIIELENETFELHPGQGVLIKKGIMHRPRAPERATILMVEGNTIEPTGD